jgi:hypothetical protein
MILVVVLEDTDAFWGISLSPSAYNFLWIVRTIDPAKACKDHTEASQDDKPSLESAIWWWAGNRSCKACGRDGLFWIIICGLVIGFCKFRIRSAWPCRRQRVVNYFRHGCGVTRQVLTGRIGWSQLGGSRSCLLCAAADGVLLILAWVSDCAYRLLCCDCTLYNKYFSSIEMNSKDDTGLGISFDRPRNIVLW